LPVGAAEGDDDGLDVGLLVGAAEGDPVGLDVGLPVGAAEGDPVGLDVGLPVGAAEGDPVGLDVGLPVGAALGDDVGLDVGPPVVVADGEVVGLDVGLPVGAAEGISRIWVGAPLMLVKAIGCSVGGLFTIGADVDDWIEGFGEFCGADVKSDCGFFAELMVVGVSVVLKVDDGEDVVLVAVVLGKLLFVVVIVGSALAGDVLIGTLGRRGL
jgi:hypothetical protein